MARAFLWSTPLIRTIQTSAALAALVLIALITATTHADPTTAPAPAPTAARYITLWYPLPDPANNGAVEFYNEETVRQEVPGSYFCAAGFAGGYFGIQDRPDKKVIIFSVWDTGKKVDQPDKAAPENQAKVISLGKGVHYTRFGNEGTGAHSDMDYNWEVGKTYHFYLRATAKEKTTEYQGWFRDPSTNAGWIHIATFEVPDGGKKMKGLYSFLEDFRRDTKSATEIRRVETGNAWARTSFDSAWIPLLKMRFTTMDQKGAAPAGIDAGVIGEHFYMQNGGDTQRTMPLNTSTTRPAAAGATPPVVPQ
jgi:hypothetical protein